jgi:DNA-binding beta-propeller fold protein YncE
MSKKAYKTAGFLKRHILLVAAFFLLYGCAATGPTVVKDRVWPDPPEVPRVKFVRSYRGPSDFAKSNMLSDILLGSGGGVLDLVKPMGSHVDRFNRLFVSDTAIGVVFVFNPEQGTFRTEDSTGRKHFQKPIGIASDANGNVFITDSQINKVSVFDKNGAYKQDIGEESNFEQPTGIAIDVPNNRIYVTDTFKHQVFVFDLRTFKQIEVIGERGTEEGQFNRPAHIWVDKNGKLYVSDTMNGKIQIFDSKGKFLKSFGGFGDVPGMFARPKGVAVDSEGHIYVIDAAFSHVQMFNEDGEVLMDFGGYGSEPGMMILPAGVSVDQDDFIYVVDSWNSRVNVYEFLGEKHKEREAKGIKLVK